MSDAPQMQDKPPRLRALRSMIAAILINLVIGCSFAFGNANLYVAKRLKSSPEETIVVMQIWAVTQFVFTFVGLELMEKVGAWTINILSLTGFVLVQLIASWIDEYYAFIFFYGILSGAFIGMGFIMALFIAWTHYPESKNIATGVILLCAGMSPCIMGPVTTALANPDNLPVTDPRLADRMPYLFRMYALIYGCVALAGSLILPPAWESKHLQEHQEAQQTHASKDFKSDQHRAAVEDVLSRHGPHAGNSTTPALTAEDIRAVHNHEVHQQVFHFGGGHHMMFIANRGKPQRVADLLVNQMKYHRTRETDHPVLSSFRAAPSLGEAKKPEHKEITQTLPEDQTALQPRTGGQQSTAGKRLVIEHNVEALHKKLKELDQGEPTCLRDAVKTITFWKLLIMVYGVSIWNYYICSNWKFVYEIELERTVTDRQLSLMITYGALSNSFVTLFSGFFAMKFQWQYLYWFASALTIFSAFSFAGVMKSYGLGAMYVVFGAGCLGIETMIFSTITSKLFGEKAGPMVYPFVLLSMTLANFSQHFFFRYYVQKTRSLEAMYYYFGAICVLGLLASVWIVLRPNRWNKQPSDSRGEPGTKDSAPVQVHSPADAKKE